MGGETEAKNDKVPAVNTIIQFAKLHGSYPFILMKRIPFKKWLFTALLCVFFLPDRLMFEVKRWPKHFNGGVQKHCVFIETRFVAHNSMTEKKD